MTDILFHIDGDAPEGLDLWIITCRPVFSRFSLRATPHAAEMLWEAGFEHVTEISHSDDLWPKESEPAPTAVFLFGANPDGRLLQRCIEWDVMLAVNFSSAKAVLHALRARRTATLIFNPVAGAGNPQTELAAIREKLEESIELNIVETSPDVSAADLARNALDQGERMILSAGGDGTVSEVAEALIDSQATLGIIPRGTANALAVAIFGDTLRLDPIGISCDAIIAGVTRTMDTAECNGKPMLLLAGVGLEAGMVQRADRSLKNKFGVLAYLVGGWEQIREQEEFDLTITCDGHTQKLRTGSLVIANAAPPSSIFAQGNGQPVFDDGYLDLTMLVDLKTPWDVMVTTLGLLSAGLTQSPAGDRVLHMRAKEVTIETSPPQKIVLDGELCGTTPVAFKIRPQSLRVIAPANFSDSDDE